MSHLRLAVLSGLIGGVLLVGAASAAAPPFLLGPATGTTTKSYLGYYDGHKDTYLITDVSSKAQAAGWGVNYSPPLASYKGAPAQYFVEGTAAAGQIAVFGSEPGEDDYNPLWEELIVKWKAGQTPVLLKQDDQIDALAKKGELTVTDAHVVLNAPITHVGK